MTRTEIIAAVDQVDQAAVQFKSAMAALRDLGKRSSGNHGNTIAALIENRLSYVVETDGTSRAIVANPLIIDVMVGTQHLKP